jgi:lipopolysaccharide export LptBFGC system permease protein LptF
MTSLSFSKGFRPQAGQVVQSPDQKVTASIGGMELRPDNTARMTNVMILQGGRYGKPAVVTLAPVADYREGIWTLYDPKIYMYSADGKRDTYVQSARSVEINFKLAEKTFQTIYLQLPLYSNAATKTFRQLAEEVALQRRGHSVDPRLLLEYHFKLSVPLSCLVFAIACPPLALRFARAGNFMGVLLSIILVFVYWNTLLAAKIIGAKYPNLLPPIVAGWGQNVVFALIGLYFLWREE